MLTRVTSSKRTKIVVYKMKLFGVIRIRKDKRTVETDEEPRDRDRNKVWKRKRIREILQRK